MWVTLAITFLPERSAILLMELILKFIPSDIVLIVSSPPRQKKKKKEICRGSFPVAVLVTATAREKHCGQDLITYYYYQMGLDDQKKWEDILGEGIDIKNICNDGEV